MAVLVIGATGFVGDALAQSLLAAGHRVQGIARTPAAARELRAQGLDPVRGDLDAGRGAVIAAAATADAVIYAAQTAPGTEAAAVADLLRALGGTGVTFIFTSGSGVLLQRTDGAWSADSFTEDDDFVVEPLAVTRKGVEDLVRAAAHDGVRAMVVRPGMI